jgi:hypothetical protein
MPCSDMGSSECLVQKTAEYGQISSTPSIRPSNPFHRIAHPSVSILVCPWVRLSIRLSIRMWPPAVRLSQQAEEARCGEPASKIIGVFIRGRDVRLVEKTSRRPGEGHLRCLHFVVVCWPWSIARPSVFLVLPPSARRTNRVCACEEGSAEGEGWDGRPGWCSR